jgi:hypothetical protein
MLPRCTKPQPLKKMFRVPKHFKAVVGRPLETLPPVLQPYPSITSCIIIIIIIIILHPKVLKCGAEEGWRRSVGPNV